MDHSELTIVIIIIIIIIIIINVHLQALCYIIYSCILAQYRS